MKKIEAFFKDYREEIHRSAAEMLPLPMPDVTEELFGEFEQTGERLGYERIYFTRRKYLAILGMEAILRVKEGKCFRKNCREEIIKKLCAVMESVCEEETWALPAHVNRRTESWQVAVDLFASETAQTLANLMDELWEELPEPMILRVQEEIRRRVLIPFFESEIPYGWWEGSEMNWNAVCAGAIGSVCIHFQNRGLVLPAEFTVCIRRICSSLTHYIDGFSDDGACMEGLGYYTYGMAFYVNFMRELEELFLISDNWKSDSPELAADRLHSDSKESVANGLRSDSKESVVNGLHSDSKKSVANGLHSDSKESVVNSLHSDSQESAVDSLFSESLKSAALKSYESLKFAATILGDEKCLKKLPRIAEFPGKCFFSDGRSVSFSDGDSRDTWRVGIWCALSKWFDDLPMPNLKSAAGVHADSCYRFVNLKMDVFETEKYLEKVLKQDPAANNLYMVDREKRAGIADARFVKSVSREKAAESTSHEIVDESVNRAEVSGLKLRKMDRIGNDENIKLTEPHGRADILTSAQWCIAESANSVGFACKGGHNDEPHNHNDIGHFIYEAGGTVYLADLGAGEYTADYFGAKRYQILCNSSAGHSVPVLNGENQSCGREYRCGGFTAYVEETFEENYEQMGETSDGVDLRYKGEKIGKQILRVQMNIGSAWPQREGTPAPSVSAQRTFRFDLQTGGLEIEDNFDRSQWESVSETLITQIPPQVEGNRVYLRGDSGTVVISVRNAWEEQRKSEHLGSDAFSENVVNDMIFENERDVDDAVSEIDGSENVETEDETHKIRVRKLEHRNHVGEAETVYAICRDVRGSRIQIRIQHISG